MSYILFYFFIFYVFFRHWSVGYAMRVSLSKVKKFQDCWHVDILCATLVYPTFRWMTALVCVAPLIARQLKLAIQVLFLKLSTLFCHWLWYWPHKNKMSFYDEILIFQSSKFLYFCFAAVLYKHLGNILQYWYYYSRS